MLCCTWISSCNIRRHYVARGTRLATFGDIMLHVELVLQLSEALCCTWTCSCNFRRLYVARGSRLATFGGIMLHVDLLLQLSKALCCTWISSCNFRRHYVARGTRLATFGGIMSHVDFLLQHIYLFISENLISNYKNIIKTPPYWFILHESIRKCFSIINLYLFLLYNL